MALFEKLDADTKAQRDAESALRSRRRDRESLTERLGIAEAAITSYRAQARQLAADGADDKAISTAEGRMRDAQDRSVTLIGAISDVDKIIAGLEAQIDQIVDKRCRSETSKAIDEMITRFEKTAAIYDAACLEYISAAKELGVLVAEARGIAAFLEADRVQLPPENAVVVREAKNYLAAVLNGARAPSLPQPQAPAPQLALVETVPTQPVFLMKASRYRDPHRGQVALGAHRVYELPLPIAKRALEIGAAIPVTDSRRRNLQGLSGMVDPELSRCTALDDSRLDEKKSDAPQITSSQLFEPSAYGRQAPKTFIVPIEPTEIVRTGTRAMPEGDEQ